MANTIIYPEKSNTSIITQEQPDTNDMTYCHTHGVSRNANHTSTTCKRPGYNHKMIDTMSNNMGGNTKLFTNQDIRWQRQPHQMASALKIDESK